MIYYKTKRQIKIGTPPGEMTDWCTEKPNITRIYYIIYYLIFNRQGSIGRGGEVQLRSPVR